MWKKLIFTILGRENVLDSQENTGWPLVGEWENGILHGYDGGNQNKHE